MGECVGLKLGEVMARNAKFDENLALVGLTILVFIMTAAVLTWLSAPAIFYYHGETDIALGWFIVQIIILSSWFISRRVR